MRILVCGGRDYGNLLGIKRTDPIWEKREQEYWHIQDTLNELSVKYSKEYNPDDNWLPFDIVIIEGGALGADRAAFDWAVCSFAQSEQYEANWDKYGKSAGPRRNKQMLDEGKPDLVVAFPGGRGTAHMVQLAKEHGVPVIEVE